MGRPSAAIVLVLAAALWPGAAFSSVGGGDETIQPGDALILRKVQCSVGLVFDGLGDLEGRVFVTTAAHCVQAIGEIASTPGVGVFGSVVFIGDPDVVLLARDYALIEVFPEMVGRVNPEVRLLPGTPQGTTVASETSVYDLLLLPARLSPGGPAGPSALAAASKALLTRDTTSIFEAVTGLVTNCAENVLGFGCSGAPIIWAGKSCDPGCKIPLAGGLPLPEGLVSWGGAGIGSVSVISLDGGGPTRGPTYEGILADAARHGFPLAVRDGPSCYPACALLS